MSRGTGILRSLLEGVVTALRPRQTTAPGKRPSGSSPKATWKQQRNSQPVRDVTSGVSPGQAGNGATRDLEPEHIRRLRPSYEPKLDGDPDPGEVIWTWVPYVENDGRGKDRPVLIIARIDEESWAACYLSTKQHRGFVSIGTGPWDSEGRESFLSPERVLRVTEAGMRRESLGVTRERFEIAVRAVLAFHRR